MPWLSSAVIAGAGQALWIAGSSRGAFRIWPPVPTDATQTTLSRGRALMGSHVLVRLWLSRNRAAGNKASVRDLPPGGWSARLGPTKKA